VARVFVDTNVLFPFSVMDLMLALTEDFVHEVLWSEALLAEWERVIVRQERRSAASAASITAAIREFFPDSEVSEAEYLHLVKNMPGDDPDDRLHMAAALAGGASAVITWNRSDFPAEPLARLGLRVECEQRLPDQRVGDELGARQEGQHRRRGLDLRGAQLAGGVRVVQAPHVAGRGHAATGRDTATRHEGPFGRSAAGWSSQQVSMAGPPSSDLAILLTLEREAGCRGEAFG
jgi:predicted nucleic acid-binding protein